MIELLFLLAILLATYARHKFRWLIGLAILAEVWSLTPMGVMTVIVFTPYLIRRILPRH